jgi:hypothetical protein
MDYYLLDNFALENGFTLDENIHFDDLFSKDFAEESEKYKEILEKIKQNNEE